MMNNTIDLELSSQLAELVKQLGKKSAFKYRVDHPTNYTNNILFMLISC